MDSESHMTGKTRYRVHKPLFGKPVLVLQVEWKRKVYSDLLMGYRTVTAWLDARVEDVTEGVEYDS